MGNSSSKRKQNEMEQLLQYWSTSEQQAIELRFKQFLADCHSSNVTNANFTPSTFNNDLTNIFTKYSLRATQNYTGKKHPEPIDLYSYLKAVTEIMHDNEAAYTLYAIAAEELDCSLEQFVSWIVKSAIPWWFIGSNLCKADNGMVWMDSEQESGAVRLTNHLLYKAEEKMRAQQEREQLDFDVWLGNQSNTNIDSKENCESTLIWKQTVTSATKIDKDSFEDWMQHTPDFLVLLRIAARVFYLGTSVVSEKRDTHSSRLAGYECPPISIPEGMKGWLKEGRMSRLLTAYDYFLLTRSLPPNAVSWSTSELAARRQTEDLTHQLLFSSRRDGTSWQIFVNRIINKGATLLIVKTRDGAIFGGYADESWLPVTDWYGNSANFLFRLDSGTHAGVLATNIWGGGNSANDHYQYLCWGKKSLPNGIGMGGQFDYAGLWIDSDFLHGHSKAGPLCTTYQSPRLSPTETFEIEEVEVILVRPLLKDDDDAESGNGGILSRAEDMEFLEMAGKKLYSRDLPQEERKDDSE